MRSRHEWLRLLGRQATDLQGCTDYLYACRLTSAPVDEAFALFRQSLQLYTATLESAPLDVLQEHALTPAHLWLD
uniref:Uncharacterized protein n=1 Tax=uncultured prokaryote TaxID=198431 RepID=A0A0H5PZC3_9ZZZZ|nr:hypothetical protein [uncultured prokaryote]